MTVKVRSVEDESAGDSAHQRRSIQRVLDVERDLASPGPAARAGSATRRRRGWRRANASSSSRLSLLRQPACASALAVVPATVSALVVVEREHLAVHEDVQPLLRVVLRPERRVGQRGDRAVLNVSVATKLSWRP